MFTKNISQSWSVVDPAVAEQVVILSDHGQDQDQPTGSLASYTQGQAAERATLKLSLPEIKINGPATSMAQHRTEFCKPGPIASN